jgi:uroporphyrinogen-III synthase
VTADAPLQGRRVVVTRAAEQAGILAEKLAELGALVVGVPAIAFAPPPSWDELDGALRSLKAFAWAAFASQNAVRFALERAVALGLPGDAFAAVKLAAIGEATAAPLREAGLAPALVCADARGEALAREIAAAAPGQRILLIRALEGRPELPDGLRAAGCEVTVVAAYQTVPPPPESFAALSQALDRGEVDAILFASPSAVRHICGGVGRERLGRAALAAIGPTTAAAIREEGLPVAVLAPRPDPTSLAAALARHFGPAPHS